MPLTSSCSPHGSAVEVASAIDSTMSSSTRRNEQPKCSGQASYSHDFDEWRAIAEHEALLATEQRVQARKGNGADDRKRAYLLLQEVPSTAVLWSPRSLERRVYAVDDLIPMDYNLRLQPNRHGVCRDGDGHSCQPITTSQFASHMLPRASSIEAGVNQNLSISFLTKRMNNAKAKYFNPNGRRTVSWHTSSNARDVLEEVELEQEWIKVKAIVVFPHLWDQISRSLPTRPKFLSTRAKEILTTCGKNAAFLLVLENVGQTSLSRDLLLPALAKKGEATVWERASSLYDRTTFRIERPEGGGQYAADLTIKVGDQNSQRVKIRVRTLHGGEELYEIIS